MHYYLGIGTNLGNREANLRQALLLLNQRVGKCIACSSVYYSEPQGFESDNQFANMVSVYDTNNHSPSDILQITQDIEREMGRTQKSINGIYHDRIIDIDILLAKNGTLSLHCATDTLTIPHPRIHERDFVTVPLREVEQILIHQSTNVQ